MLKRLYELLVKCREGVTAIEYGLIAALVGVAIIGGVTLLGGSLNTMFTNVSTTLGGATSGSTPTTTVP